MVAGSPTVPNQVAVIDTLSGERQIVRRSADLPVSSDYVSVPRALEFPTDGSGRTAHALVYPPLNPDYEDGGRGAAARSS